MQWSKKMPENWEITLPRRRSRCIWCCRWEYTLALDLRTAQKWWVYWRFKQMKTRLIDTAFKNPKRIWMWIKCLELVMIMIIVSYKGGSSRYLYVRSKDSRLKDQTGYYVVRPGNDESACLYVYAGEYWVVSCDPHEEFDSVFLVQDLLEEEKPDMSTFLKSA